MCPCGGARVMIRFAEAARAWGLDALCMGRTVSYGRLSVCFSRLADLHKVGMPIPAAVMSIAHSEQCMALRRLLIRCYWAVRRGEPLSTGLVGADGVIPTEVVAILAAGEANGDVDRALDAASQLLDARALRAAGRRMVVTSTACLYVAGSVAVGLVRALGPRGSLLHELCAAAGVALAYLGAFLCVLLAGAVLGKRGVDRLLLSTPLASGIYARDMSRFLSTLADCLDAGHGLHTSFLLARDTVANTRVAEELWQAWQSSARGDGWRAFTERLPGLDRGLSGILVAGWLSGALPDSLRHAARFLQRDQEDRQLSPFSSEGWFVSLLSEPLYWPVAFGWWLVRVTVRVLRRILRALVASGH